MKKERESLIRKDGFQTLLASLVCILGGLIVGYVVLLIIEPSGAFEAIVAVMKSFLRFPGALKLKYFGQALVRTAPLLMCALSVLFAYKVGMFNIGAAGQYCAGACAALYAALPLMRAQGGGRIVNVSSVAAPLAIPFQAWYSVSKAAVNAYTLALFNEVKQFGVSVCAVMPGDICTGFTKARQKSHAGDDVYKGRIARSVAKMEKDEENGMAPEVAGRFLARVALKKRVKPYYAIGLSYKFFVLLSRILPIRLIGWLLGLLYAGE